MAKTLKIILIMIGLLTVSLPANASENESSSFMPAPTCETSSQDDHSEIMVKITGLLILIGIPAILFCSGIPKRNGRVKSGGHSYGGYGSCGGFGTGGSGGGGFGGGCSGGGGSSGGW
ncbi:hypothetical protein [Tichowtungia aerotolerans]|uniref:hypothetical protein n=1 Tax=Tichowtungia aerotolerans TaxID=2697043 RepID=UPI001E2933F4|nr:hypothetical protein [Tichowtungia aerotolerans]